jgi:hypothetical protein
MFIVRRIVVDFLEAENPCNYDFFSVVLRMKSFEPEGRKREYGTHGNNGTGGKEDEILTIIPCLPLFPCIP